MRRRPRLEELATKRASCIGADAIVRPGRAATLTTVASSATANVVPAPAAVPPHNFKKPPSNVNPAPQECRNAAHRASGGWAERKMHKL